MAMIGNDLGDAVFGVINQSGMNASEKAALKVELRKVYSAVVTYIVANMGVKNIEVSEPAETIETYVAGAGNNGGSLTGQIPVVGSVKRAAATRNQSNDGTGLIE